MTKKELIKELIVEQKYEQLTKLAIKNHSQTLKFIQMHLYGDLNKPLRWYAIEALGKLARDLAPQEPEVYKNLIRRFLWAMNDESGNVPWSSPEGIGSIIANQPFLFGEYTPMLVTNALDNPMCHRGMLWAVGRVGKVKASLVLPFIKEILPFLDESDPNLSGYAAWALGELKSREAVTKLKNLQNNNSLINIFIDGKLVTESVGSLAQRAIGKIEMVS